MVKEELRKKIADAGYELSLFYDNQSYDDSIIGVDEDGRVVYDYDKMVEEYIADEFGDKELSDEERDDAVTSAIEWIDYNTIRATPYFGPLAPVIVQDISYMDEGDEDKEGFQYVNMINGEPYTKEIIFKI